MLHFVHMMNTNYLKNALNRAIHIVDNHITEISINNQDITELPRLLYLKKLKVLNISRNNISEFNNVCELDVLEALNLSDNAFEIFPNLYSFTTLRWINIENIC